MSTQCSEIEDPARAPMPGEASSGPKQTNLSIVELLLRSDVRSCLTVPIRTARLLLRPFQEADTPDLATLLADPEATQHIGGVRSLEETQVAAIRMAEAFRARGFGTLAVVPQHRATCIGYCGVRPLTQTCDLEIAFALAREHWGHGYATEAAAACIEATFSALPIDSIVATVYEANHASRRVLEKLGMADPHFVFAPWPRERALLVRLARQSWITGSPRRQLLTDNM
jgi:RimJ/RimL family protein N-acetyltransferase